MHEDLNTVAEKGGDAEARPGAVTGARLTGAQLEGVAEKGVGASVRAGAMSDVRPSATSAPAPFDAVLFASYGTSRESAREQSIEPVTEALAEALGCARVALGAAVPDVGTVARPAPDATLDRASQPPLVEAYTSAKARRVLARRGTPVPDVSEALHALAHAGARRVLVVPGHLVSGVAFAQVKHAVETCSFLFARLALAHPLLHADADVAAVARALAERNPRVGGEALVIVAHGVEGGHADAGSVCTSLFMHLRELGRDDAYVGSMKAYPQLADVRGLVALDRERLGLTRVRLVPLMLTAAAHASLDIDGEREGSWRRGFEADGLAVVGDLEGLGALSEVQALYVEHARRAWAERGAGQASAPADAHGASNALGAVPSGSADAPETATSTFGTDTLAPHARFPLFVDLRGARCLVVGLGTVGMRRARTLARFGARVLAVDPSPRSADEREAARLGIVVERREWMTADVEGRRLVVASTSVRTVNAAVARACGRLGVPVSVADSAEESTCFFPAVCESARLVAGVVSDGAHHELLARAATRVRVALAEVDHG